MIILFICVGSEYRMLVPPHAAASKKSSEWLQLPQPASTGGQATLERSLQTRSGGGVLVCWWLKCHHLSLRVFNPRDSDAR